MLSLAARTHYRYLRVSRVYHQPPVRKVLLALPTTTSRVAITSSTTTPNCRLRLPTILPPVLSWAHMLTVHALILTPVPPLAAACPSWSPTTTTLVPAPSTLPLRLPSRPHAEVPPTVPPIPVPPPALPTVPLLARSPRTQTQIALMFSCLLPPTPLPDIAGVALVSALAASWLQLVPLWMASAR